MATMPWGGGGAGVNVKQGWRVTDPPYMGASMFPPDPAPVDEPQPAAPAPTPTPTPTPSPPPMRYDDAPKAIPQAPTAPTLPPVPPVEPTPSTDALASAAGLSPGGPIAEAKIPASLKGLAAMAGGSGGGEASPQPMTPADSLRPGLGQRLYPQYNASLAALQRAIY